MQLLTWTYDARTIYNICLSWCIKRNLLFLNDIGWTSNILSFFLILVELIPLWRLAYLLFFRKNEEKLSHEISIASEEDSTN